MEESGRFPVSQEGARSIWQADPGGRDGRPSQNPASLSVGAETWMTESVHSKWVQQGAEGPGEKVDGPHVSPGGMEDGGQEPGSPEGPDPWQ